MNKNYKKRIYIVPGFGESTRSKNYREIIKYARDLGFKIIPVKIIWKINVPLDNFVKQVRKQILLSGKEDVVLGFSFGALIMTLLSKEFSFKRYIFCSVSPYFKENVNLIPEESKNYFGKKFISSLNNYDLPKSKYSNTDFLIGNKDWPLAIKNTEKMYKLWKGPKSMSLIKNTDHNLTQPNYNKKIKEIIKGL